MSAMLEVKDLEVSYGKIKAVKGISFTVDEGEVVDDDLWDPVPTPGPSASTNGFAFSAEPGTLDALIDRIRGARVRHDIGSHSGRHLYYDRIPASEVEDDLAFARSVHDQHGLAFDVLADPPEGWTTSMTLPLATKRMGRKMPSPAGCRCGSEGSVQH